MARILMFLALAFLVWFAVRLAGARRGRAPADPRRTAAPGQVEPMAQCAWCGAYVPSSQALVLPDGRDYCGVEHRDAAARRAAAPDAQG